MTDMTSTRPAIDLRNVAWSQGHGDLIVYGTWYMAEEEAEPCLVLMRAADAGNTHETRPVVVLLGDAWVYAEKGGDFREAQERGSRMAEVLQLGFERRSMIRVLSLIRFHLEDLVHMPPRPDLNRRVMADLITTNRVTGETEHVEITDDV